MLDPYQVECQDCCYNRFMAGVYRQLCVLATGAGKTVLASTMPKRFGFTKRKLFLTHRIKLAHQTAKQIVKWNPESTVGIEMGSLHSSEMWPEEWIIGSVRSLGMKGSDRLKRFNPADFDLVVDDECFPAGTLIDGIPIEKVVAGDVVLSYDESNGSIVRRKVTRVFKNLQPTHLVHIRIGCGELVCTANHPIYTQRGWKHAINITRSDCALFMVQRTCGPFGCEAPQARFLPRDGAGILFADMQQGIHVQKKFRDDDANEPQVLLCANEEEQPDAQARSKGQSGCIAQGYGPQASGTWRERDRIDQGAGDDRDRSRMGNGGSRAYWKRARKWLSQLLQIGRWEPRFENRDRSGGQFPCASQSSRAGSQEGFIPQWVGVDSVTFPECRDIERLGGMPSDGYVYNLEVEGTHTYFANGFLVHNCHHLPGDKDWQRIHAHFGLNTPDTGGILNVAFTATPERGDGLGLDGFYDEIVYKWMLWPHAIEQGYLVPPSVERVKTNVSLDGVQWAAGKWNEKELAKEINTDHRNKLIVLAWMKHAMDLKTLVFTDDIQHAVDLAAVFRAHGITAEPIWGTDKEQDAKFLRHRSGVTTVLLNAQLTIEGYDDPTIRCIILASPNASPSPVWQKIGRGTRIETHIREQYRTLHAARAAGVSIAKENLIVLDVCDNCTKHPPITVASLFGMPRDLEMRGASIAKVKKEFERIAREFPDADVSKIKDLVHLKTFTEHLDLFKIHEPPEIHRLTRVIGWRKSGDGYMIANHAGVMEIRQDLLGKYAITGNMQGKVVGEQSQSLEGAFNVADRIVVDAVGRGLAFKDAGWRDKPPSPKAIEYARTKGITIIPKTAGELSNAINAKNSEPATPQHIRYAQDIGVTDIPAGASRAYVNTLIKAAKKRQSDPEVEAYHGDF